MNKTDVHVAHREERIEERQREKEGWVRRVEEKGREEEKGEVIITSNFTPFLMLGI